MKPLITIITLLLLPILAMAQFSSAQRQMNMSNNIVRQQNQMSLQIQSQQRLLANYSNRTVTAQSNLAKEEKKIQKLSQKVEEKKAARQTERDRLANLQNSNKNTNESDIKGNQKKYLKLKIKSPQPKKN
ncbi:hypothetical protein [Flavobacterium frigoris]|uniref:Uncharacterized protein n=1 Tax=Flavobacterium frigoris TaxID=229204 RepID=A0A1H9GDH7_FLAFI|nr:hypothetical protein [Flavobacterium frigoris]SEQ48140.1 hypothetical protein SAMN05444355_102466 [Flavobacterium frigoris]